MSIDTNTQIPVGVGGDLKISALCLKPTVPRARTFCGFQATHTLRLTSSKRAGTQG